MQSSEDVLEVALEKFKDLRRQSCHLYKQVDLVFHYIILSHKVLSLDLVHILKALSSVL